MQEVQVPITERLRVIKISSYWIDFDTHSRHIVVSAVCEEAANEIERLNNSLRGWMDTAAEMARNADFYRGLLEECAKHLGSSAYTADDGTVMDSPLLLKIPDLVAASIKANDQGVEDEEA